MARRKILVAEDDKDLARLIAYNFEKEGFEVLSCVDGEAALGAARREKPDVVLLDVMLPKMDGLEVCRALRRESQVPVIFLTAKKSEVDRILGFKLGADDYVTKPFSIVELVARVRAILRRGTGVEPTAQAVFRRGALEVDFERREARIHGKPAGLTPKEFDFLKLLIEADGRVLSRTSLLERLWGYEGSLDIETRTVDQHIARLRGKLGSEAGIVVTVTGTGYRLRKP